MKKSISKGEAWFLLIAGLIMGTVFSFGMQYWNAPIAREEAIHTTAVFSSYKEQLNRGHVEYLAELMDAHARKRCSELDENVREMVTKITPYFKK